ncbi:chemotaxis protein [Streptomyces alfalfae]|uniref:Chemotaxis protein n=1 Tax=Streptomyces alfalfae TaxID=1642299 RepID=A0A7T4TWN4_9ACTN|nr:chemotaxis protein [Streptomyces alfalfae]QQC88070.1 chemotaxis protein [Streptomyces alfalfae]
MHPCLTPDTLAGLRRPRPYPAVTVLLPTHRTGPEAAQDAVRLRGLVAEAEQRLRADPAVTGERRAEVMAALDRAVAEVDPARAEDGLALFAAPGEHQVWTLARPVPARVVLSDTFVTRNLVAAHAAEHPYWLLAVAADRATLWDGRAADVTEHTADDFPLTRDLDDPDVERKERIGDVPSTFRSERTRGFLREAARAMSGILAVHPRPIYVAGEAAALSLLDELGMFTEGATPVPHGGLAGGTAARVRQAMVPLLAAREEAQLDTTLRDLDDARGHQRFAAGLDEVWRHAVEGRVRLLAVEDTYRATVREAGGHLVPAAADDLDAHEDIVDEVVEHALETGAGVRFVLPDALAGHGRIAAALRY